MSEAHALLEAAHVTGPLVLLGRSFGGMIVTHYADVMPQDVVGVVVLDTPAPSAEFTEKSEPGLVWDNAGQHPAPRRGPRLREPLRQDTHPTSTPPCC